MAEPMNGNWPLITVFGGSGFLGRHVVRALVKREWRVRIACRRPNLAGHLQPLGKVGQIHAVQANVRYPASLREALLGADAAVNLVGVLRSAGAQGFDAVHVAGAKAVAQAAREAGVAKFVQMSAIGAEAGSASAYARSKAAGEAAIREILPEAVVMRPSVLFGPEDDFFNRFAAMARVSPFLPLIGGGATRFQPVFAGDVAEAVARALEGRATPGAIYELGGPQIASFRDLLAFICKTTGRNRRLVSLSWGAARPVAFLTEASSAVTLGLFPDWLVLTRDQIELLRRDNVVSPEALAQSRTLQALGIEPDSFEAVAPTYLWRFRKTGQYETRRLA
ncbi:MAG TPA: complex I NDUFA9 subunit family protein [Beijerinckiaceae bacterium]|nr:complex I NDUFA9 subunit family protein [Beijerinckiaceae bacterium]HVB90044.1 complex I NDUFA9 subunit family protein [Beijerinckiaceae bacterium]